MREKRMKRRKLLSLVVLIIVLGVMATGCTSSSASSASSWPGLTIADGEGFFAYAAQVYALDTKNGDLLWAYPQETSSSRQFYAAPAIGTDLVVVGDYANALAAIDRQNGKEKWQFTGAEDRYIASALVTDETVYAPNTDHNLYVLDKDGNLKWRFQADGPNWTKPLAGSDYLYMVSMDHYLYALNFDYDSTALETDGQGQRVLVTEPAWSLELSAAVVADPVIADGILYAGTVDGNLYAIDLADQDVLWSFNSDGGMGAIWGSPIVTAGTIYVGDQLGNIYAIDAASGTAVWPAPFAAGTSVVSGGVALEDHVVYATSDGKILTINADKEPKTLVTLESTLYASLGLDGESIIVAPASKTGIFTAIDSNGNEIWNYLPAD